MHPLGPELRSFRPSARALWPICALPVIATAPIALRRIFLADEMTFWAAAAVILLVPASGLLTYLLLLPLLSIFSVRVHELGIQAYDVYGRRASVAWPQVHSVRPISVAGLTYLRIATTTAGRTLWLPCFLNEKGAFARLVTEQAGEGHPLALSLSTP